MTSKERAPRNRTLDVSKVDQSFLEANTIQITEMSSYQDIRNKIINQDLFDCIDYLPDSFVDLLIIDPPYNLDKVFDGRRFAKLESNEYEHWVRSWFSRLIRCLKPNATIYVCCDWQSSNAIQNVLKDFVLIRNRITWEREKGRGAKTNWKNCSEDIWYCTASKDFYFDVDSVKLMKRVIAPYKNEDGRPKDWEETAQGRYRLTHPSNLWTDISIPFWSMPENTDHPTQKPEKLIAKLILSSSREGDVVFDPFCGSGTTCVVAKKLGRNYVGIEISQEYCKMAAVRIIKAEQDQSIQGYKEGVFWERNSGADQKQLTNKKDKSPKEGLFSE